MLYNEKKCYLTKKKRYIIPTKKRVKPLYHMLYTMLYNVLYLYNSLLTRYITVLCYITFLSYNTILNTRYITQMHGI